MNGCFVSRDLELLRVDGRRNGSRVEPDLLIIQRTRRYWPGILRGSLGRVFVAFYRDCDDVVPDRKAIAVSEPMRLRHPMIPAIKNGPIGRYVVQPIASVLVADLTMLAGDVTSWVG
jgi:hypothetical protein